MVGAVVAAVIFTYRRVRVSDGRVRDRVVLTALRVAALALVLFCLFRPTLVVRAAVDQQNVVAVLLDDSRSMQIPDLGGTSARDVRQRAVRRAGQSHHEVAVGAVSACARSGSPSTATRVASGNDLTFGGSQTRLGRRSRRRA